MNMPVLRLALVACALSGAGYAAVPAPPPQEAPAAAPAAEPAPARFAELLELLDARGVFSLRNPDAERRLVEALLQAVGCGARILPARPGAGPDRPAVSAPVLLQARFAYLFLANLDAPNAVTTLEEALATAETRDAAGLILDLRFCQGGQATLLEPLAVRIGEWDKPLALLTGPDTVGGAELLAAVARARAGAVTVGQPTRGCFVSLEPIALAGGQWLLLPLPVTEVAGVKMPEAPVPADLPVDGALPAAQVSGLTSDRYDAFPDRDPALRRAVDLLTTVCTMGRKRF